MRIIEALKYLAGSGERFWTEIENRWPKKTMQRNKSITWNEVVLWKPKSLGYLSHLVIIAFLLEMVMGPAAFMAQAVPQNVQSDLIQIAAQSPDQAVAVIVQKSGKGSASEEMAARLGGTVTQDLPIINAYVAELRAKDVLALAQDPSVRWVSLDSKVQQSSESPSYAAWATSLSPYQANTFYNGQAAVDSALGPNDTYAVGGYAKGAFNGIEVEVTPDQIVSKVEIALRLYTLYTPVYGQDPILSINVGGVPSKTTVLNHSVFSGCIGKTKACLIYVDVTPARSWLWSDFDSTQDLTVIIDQSKFRGYWAIYYDAVGIRVSENAGSDTSDTQMVSTQSSGNSQMSMMSANNLSSFESNGIQSPDTSSLANAYNAVVRATDVWNEGPGYLKGDGTTIAVVDSGIIKHQDLGNRLIKSVNFNKAFHDSADRYGHGTFVSSIIAGNGLQNNRYMGIAPKSQLINVRVSDDVGSTTESDVLAALQWILTYRNRYNIRVVNLSLNSSMEQSYQTSPMDAAVEILWFNGIVVVVSAGNNGSATLYPPANDPFVITVGATDDKGTLSLDDDVVAGFSAFGVTQDGIVKPDLVAPGKNIVALLPDHGRLTLGKDHPENRVDNQYFRMSGTSMAAPQVTGAIAILLQNEPNLTPDQVKYRLMNTANKNWPGYNPNMAGSGYLDIYSAIHATSVESANTGVSASSLLTTGNEPITSSVSWNSVSWNSVSWNSVSWNSVSWNSVSWNSVSWNSDYWGN